MGINIWVETLARVVDRSKFEPSFPISRDPVDIFGEYYAIRQSRRRETHKSRVSDG